MLKQGFITINDEAAWQAKLDGIAHGPAHTWHYNRAIQFSSKRETFLYYAETDYFSALCPLAIREKFGQQDVVTPYGYGGLITKGYHDHFLEQSRQFLSDQGLVCGYMQLHPTFCAEDYCLQIPAATTIYILDLTQPLSVLQTNLSKVHRYELKNWEKKPVELIFDKNRIMTILPNLYEQTLARVQANVVYHFSTATLTALLENEHAIAIGAAVNNKIEAISVFLYTPYMADYFLNASDEPGRNHTRGLLWAAIKYLQEKNVKAFNIGGGIKPGDALDDFKRRFGGTSKSSHVLKQIYNPILFDKICQESGVEKKNTNYFPPYYA